MPAFSPESKPRTLEEIQTLTQFDFPEEFYEDENGLLELSAQDWSLLEIYFEFHGLRLPADAHAQTSAEIWRELRVTYGPLVRLASRGRAAQTMPDNTTADQRAYALAVGSQNLPMARRRARPLFAGRHRSNFLT